METTKEQALELIVKLLSHKPSCNIDFNDGYNVKVCLEIITKAFKELDEFEKAKPEKK